MDVLSPGKPRCACMLQMGGRGGGSHYDRDWAYELNLPIGNAQNDAWTWHRGCREERDSKFVRGQESTVGLVIRAHGSGSELFNQLMGWRQEERTHFHFIEILHRYRAVGHIRSKALFWFECKSTREKREAITFRSFHLYIQTPPVLHVYCYWDVNCNPTLIAASYRDLDDN